MLAQTDVGQLAPVFAFLAAAAVAFGPGAIGVTKLVDGVRHFDTDDSWPKITWIILAFAIAAVVCLVFQINLASALLKQLPAFSDSATLDGVGGQLVTALGMGGMASYWHERMDLASSTAKAASA